jgi:prepilin-type processing-associated H-X9-DG protein
MWHGLVALPIKSPTPTARFREDFMSTSLAALVLVALGQVPSAPAPDPRVKAIAPFVSSDVFAVIQVDVAKLDVRKLSATIGGDSQTFVPARGMKMAQALSEGLKSAGAKELYVVFSIIDMPGQPFLVVPLADGAQAEGIARAIHAEPTPIHNAIVSGRPEALARLRGAGLIERPELSAAFGAVRDEPLVVRLLVLPSADSRRVFEEMMPRFPEELGGGPITDFTQGLIWAAAGIENADKPAIRIEAASRDAATAKALVRLGENVVGFLRRSPQVLSAIPDLEKVLPDVHTVIAENRITLAIDARQSAALIEAFLRPARAAAVRAQCVNNLKQIGLAFHNFHSQNNAFPPSYSRSIDGKPLLSWRVLILPFLGEKALFDQFHLDEPWDSPHNRTLISRMPAVFRCPVEKEALAADGKTRYLTPRGAGTIMRGAEPVAIRTITDGTSNTILAIDAGDDHAVAWTQPADWEIDPDPGIEGVFKSHEPGGTNSLFADGSVRFIHATIAPLTLRALLTRAGGETIQAKDF